VWEKCGKINNTNDLNFSKPLVSLTFGALGEIRTHDFWKYENYTFMFLYHLQNFLYCHFYFIQLLSVLYIPILYGVKNGVN